MKALRFILILLLSLVVLVNTSCSPSEGSETPPEKEPDTLPQTESIKATGNKHDGPYLEYGAKTESGYYELITWPDDMYASDQSLIRIGNIVYTDYASAQRVFLCNVPGCAHNNKDCSSYLEYSGFCLLFTNYTETKLYVISGGDMEVDYNREDELPSIIQMDMDGTNRKELIRLSANEYFSFNNVIIAGDEHLYTCVSRVDDSDGGTKTVKELVKISLIDGSRQKLRDMDEMWDILSSVWKENDLIISHADIENNEYYLLRISTENGEALETFGPYGPVTIYYSAETLLTAEYDSSTCIIKRFDLTTGDQTGEVLVPGEPAGGLSCYQYEEGIAHLMFGVREGNNIRFEEYLLDFDKSQYWGLEMEYDDNGTKRKVGALSETEDYFFVIHGTEQGYVTLVDKNGIPHKYRCPRYQRALILKEDYWGNISDYIEIDDKVTIAE